MQSACDCSMKTKRWLSREPNKLCHLAYFTINTGWNWGACWEGKTVRAVMMASCTSVSGALWGEKMCESHLRPQNAPDRIKYTYPAEGLQLWQFIYITSLQIWKSSVLEFAAHSKDFKYHQTFKGTLDTSWDEPWIFSFFFFFAVHQSKSTFWHLLFFGKWEKIWRKLMWNSTQMPALTTAPLYNIMGGFPESILIIFIHVELKWKCCQAILISLIIWHFINREKWY